MLAGGSDLGLKHGSHLDFNQGHFKGYQLDKPGEHYSLCSRPANPDAHMSNLLLLMAQRMGVETDKFGDSGIDRLLFGFEATKLHGCGDQSIVQLEITRHTCRIVDTSSCVNIGASLQPVKNCRESKTRLICLEAPLACLHVAKE